MVKNIRVQNAKSEIIRLELVVQK